MIRSPRAHGGSPRIPWLMLRIIAVLGFPAAAAACGAARQPAAAVRIADYLAVHREVAPAIADAMESGHVVLGMDAEQVRAVLGPPVQKVEGSGSPAIDRWLYPGHALHQGHFRFGASSLYRLVFVDGRLRLIEAL